MKLWSIRWDQETLGPVIVLSWGCGSYELLLWKRSPKVYPLLRVISFFLEGSFIEVSTSIKVHSPLFPIKYEVWFYKGKQADCNTYHLIPRSARKGERWKNSEAILLLEWGTKGIWYAITAEITGPLAKMKHTMKSLPLMADPSIQLGSQR